MSNHEILVALRYILDILSEDIGTTALTYPGTSPAARAYYALTSLYMKLLVGESSEVE
jgi:hypothetical protein